MGTANRHVLACLSILALVAGCSTPGSSASSSAIATASPTDDGSALVYGTMSCQRTSMDTSMEGENEVVLEHFRCAYAVNDPRLDGAILDGDFTTTFEPADAPSARWEATVTMTKDDGSWHGHCLGALVLWKTGPGGPYNYGECTFTGSGAYEGLVYHELGAGGNAVLTLAGSIEQAEQ